MPMRSAASGEREGVGVALEDEVGDGVVQAERLAEVGVEDAAPVVRVLLGERRVEAVGVAEGVDVGGGGAFAEHLDDGVAGDEVDEQEDDRDDDPEDGQREEDAAERASSRARCGHAVRVPCWRVYSSRRLGGADSARSRRRRWSRR